MQLNSQTTRRSFMKTAGAAIAVPWFVRATALGAEGRPPASDRIVMGAIGVGGRGRGDMAGFMGRKEVQVVAVCDVNAKHRGIAKEIVDKKYGDKGCAEHNDFRDVCTRADIDAVLVATPDHWHALVTIEACRNGKDVFCEKPLSLTIVEGRAMVTAARRYGRVFSSGSQRVLDDYGHFAQAVRSGDAGEIKEVFVGVGGPSRRCYLPGQPVPDGMDWDMWLGPAPWAPYHPYRCGGAYRLGGKGWRTWYDYSGGMMTDWGGHKFGGALFAVSLENEQPVEVIPPDGKKHEHLTYRFANGILVYRVSKGRLRFVGTKGTVPGALAREQAAMPGYKGTGGIQGDFLHCAKTRERPFRDVELAHNTAVVCHLGNIAYELGRPLKWNPAKEEFIGDDQANRMRYRPMREPWTIQV